MLVLSRHRQEWITIELPDGSNIRLMVVEIYGDKVRLGFEAASEVKIWREELIGKEDR
mgnify:CR=1 FL=1